MDLNRNGMKKDEYSILTNLSRLILRIWKQEFLTISSISRNSAVFYWKSANLIGSPTVFYSPIENSHARVAHV